MPYLLSSVLCAFSMFTMSLPGLGQESNLDQARLLRSQNREYEAFDLLEQGAETLSAEGLLLKGVLLAELGRTGEAKRIFLQLIREQPTSPEPFNNLAVLYATAGDYDLALKALHHAIETRPEFLTTYENLNQVSTRMATEAYGRETGRRVAVALSELHLNLLAVLTSETTRPSEPVDEQADLVATTVFAESGFPAASVALRSYVGAARSTGPGGSDGSAGSDDPIDPYESSHMELPGAGSELQEIDPSPETVASGDAARDTLEVTGRSDVQSPDPGLAWLMVQQWAKARTNRSPSEYAAFYSHSFEPGRGLSREEWDGRLQRKFGSSESLSIALEFLEARRLDSNHTEIRFRQSLTLGANSFGATVTLGLVWEEGGWKIRSEYRNQ